MKFINPPPMGARPLSMPTPAEFSWATAPLNDFRAPVIASAGYVLVVLVLERLMRLRGRGFETKYLQAVHNAILCVLSLTMAVGTAAEVFGGSRALTVTAVSSGPRAGSSARSRGRRCAANNTTTVPWHRFYRAPPRMMAGARPALVLELLVLPFQVLRAARHSAAAAEGAAAAALLPSRLPPCHRVAACQSADLAAPRLANLAG